MDTRDDLLRVVARLREAADILQEACPAWTAWIHAIGCMARDIRDEVGRVDEHREPTRWQRRVWGLANSEED